MSHEPRETWEQMEARHARERYELMREITNDVFQMGHTRRVAVRAMGLQAINRKVAEKHGIEPAVLVGDARDWATTAARAEAFHMAKEAGFSLSQIGKYWGGRDHTTVLHGIKRFEEREVLQ